MSTFIDLTGKRFGRLYVEGRAENRGRRVYFRCICDCGNVVSVNTNSLKNGNTKSCGCIRRETTRASSKTHGMCKTKLYTMWRNMKARCMNKNNTSYHWYGERGITICDEWLNSFEAFYNWAINSGYSHDLSIDRIDVNGNYCPTNCRFATKKEQARNMRSCRLYKGKPISQLCEEYGLNYGYVRRRLNFYHDPESKFFG